MSWPRSKEILVSPVLSPESKSLAISGIGDGHRNRKSKTSLRFRCAKGMSWPRTSSFCAFLPTDFIWPDFVQGHPQDTLSQRCAVTTGSLGIPANYMADSCFMDSLISLGLRCLFVCLFVFCRSQSAFICGWLRLFIRIRGPAGEGICENSNRVSHPQAQ